MPEQQYYQATGKRKTAIAQVRLMDGSGAIVVNGKPYDETFSLLRLKETILHPLRVTNTADRFNIMVKVAGGGIVAQAGAIGHGISRALVKIDESFKPVLRSYGLLTRDARIKERQKYGLRRARKARQYRKR